MAPGAEQGDVGADIWRKIPPEEKLELMARAQSKGLGSAAILLIITGTMSVGLKIPWIFWSAFMCIPFVFQLASAKAWRDIKPRTVLEYLAARSAARRYAFGSNSKDLTISLLFRGVFAPDFSQEEEEEALEARVANRDHISVWVALFPDTVVIMSERPGGAHLEFAHALSDKLAIEAVGFDDSGAERSVSIVVEGRRGEKHSWIVTSPYPAALLVFERKARTFIAEQKALAEKDRLAYHEMFSPMTDSTESFEFTNNF